MPSSVVRPPITVDGSLADWLASERIDYGDVPGFSLYATEQNGSFYFALSGNVAIGANTTFWFNTDQNTATGYQIFDYAGGAEYNLTIAADGTASLYTGGAGQTLVLANIPIAYSPNKQAVEFAVPAAALGSPTAIDTLYWVNGAVYGPSAYTNAPYVAFANTSVEPTTTATRIAIVYSATTAANYFSQTAYTDLVLAAEDQAMQAGVPYDLISESDLTNLSKLVNYSAIVFPSFTDVQASQVTAITDTLLEASKQYGVGLITSGDFMTNDQTGAALPGNPYAAMNTLFDAFRVTGGNSANVTINSSDATQTVFKEVAPGALIQSYTGVAWTAYQSVSGTGQTIATETVNGQTYTAALATTTGGKNVLFSSNGVMADSNLLGEAIDYVAQPAGLTVKLDMSRFKGIFAVRMDMDQSQFVSDVSPAGATGIYDQLIPILQQWYQQYDFTGSYYFNIGDNPTAADPTTTNWSATLPYMQAIEALGGEIGTHSYSHLINPPTTIFTAATTTDTPAGSIQITLANVPSFYGVTVGMVVSGLNIGPTVLLPGVAGEAGFTTNTFVTAVSGNTVTIQYMPGGYGTSNIGVLGDVPVGTILDFSLPPENTNFLETGTGTTLSGDLNPFTYAYEFGQSAALLSSKLGVPIYGAAVPGASETVATAANILPYFPSVAATATSPGYTGYVTGGWTGIGSGYPSAIGLDPSQPGSVYIAPNMTFDFSEILYEGKTPAQAEADWLAQFATNAANSAGTPIDVLPIHDYGVTAWETPGSTVTSPFTTQMFSDIISYAYSQGYEFLTLEEIAQRTADFAASGVTTAVSGNVVTATVTAPQAGQFGLTIANQGTNVIQNVANYYAYDSTDVFLSDTNTTYAVTVGATADVVTHIDLLPMRAELVSVSGDGLYNLNFSALGSGTVEIAVGAVGSATPTVTGATIASYVGNVLDLTLASSGLNTVTVQFLNPPPVEAVSTVAFSADSGASATDFVTNVASQTITGTINAALAAGDTVKVSLDNGVTWQTATAAVGATTFSLAGVTLTGSGTLIAEVVKSPGTPSQAFSHAYVLDQVSPIETVAVVAMTDDSGVAGDFITNNGAAGRVVSGTLSSVLNTNETLKVSFNGGTSWTAASVTGTTWSVTDTTSHTTNWTIEAEVMDLAGNIGPLATQAVTYDVTPPAAPSTPDLTAASDSGISNTDNITNVVTPIFVGTAVAGITVTLYDDTNAIGTGVAAANGSWSITVATALANGVHAVDAVATDVAGNVGPASGTLSVTIDMVAPVAPSVPKLTAASDDGISNTDNVTSITTPTFTGTAEAGSTVTLLDGTTVIGTAVATGGSYSITASVLAIGNQNITATATDVAGNVSVASAADVVTIVTSATTSVATTPSPPDMTAATDTGSSNTDNITSDSTPTFTGTAEAGATVTLYDGTTVVGSGTATTASVWTITSTVLADGNHSITAQSVNLLSLISALSAALPIVIDTQAPVAPSVPKLTAASDNGTSNTDNLTSITTPIFTGTAEAGSTVTLLDGTIVIGTAVATGGSYSITASVLANGIQNITATAKDVAGNVSVASAADVVTIVTAATTPSTPLMTAATDTGPSSTDGITKNTTPTFTGTAEAGATVTLYDGTTVIGSGKANTAGTWTVTSTKLANGSQSITAKAVDQFGLVSALSAALPIVIDTVAPAAPSTPDLTAASDSGIFNTDNITNVVTPTFTGTAEAGSTVTLYDGTKAIGTGVAAANGSWSITVATALANGVHAVDAVATDVAGNVGPASGTLSVTIDTVAPVAPSVPKLTAASDNGISNTDNITNITTPTFIGTAEAGSTVTLLDGTTVIGTAVATGGSYSITASVLANGIQNITATAKDVAGNVSVASAPDVVTIVRSATTPSTPLMTAATDTGRSSTDNITSDSTPTFTGTAEAGATVTLYDGTKVIGSTKATTAGIWTITSMALADGNHGITAKAVDQFGFVSTLSAALPIVIDTLAPAAPTTPDLTAASDSGISNTDNITNVVTPTFTGSAEAGSTVTLYNGTTQMGTTIANATGVWSITSTANLAQGVNAISATATDAAGNVSALSGALAATIDSVAPAGPPAPTLTAASDTGISNTDHITSNTQPVFVGTAEAGSTVTLYDGTTSVGTATAIGGTWTITASPLPNGVQNFTVTAMDAAGNVSTASPATSVTIDTIAPAAPVFTAGTATRLTGTGEAGDSIRIISNNATISSVTVGATGTWNWTFIAPTSPLTVTAIQTDLAGNVSARSGLAFIGTSGADTLTSSAGNDFFIGGAGADTFTFSSVFGKDTIADFTPGGAAHDIINFHGSAVLNSYANVMSHAAQVGMAVVITQDAGDTVTLYNVGLTALTATDFKFV